MYIALAVALFVVFLVLIGRALMDEESRQHAQGRSRSSAGPATRSVSSGVGPVHKLLRDMCYEVMPECLEEKRNDGAYIYVVPLEMRASKSGKNKNLLTVWPGVSSVRMRIMSPDGPSPPEEIFNSGKMSEYRSRIASLAKAWRV